MIPRSSNYGQFFVATFVLHLQETDPRGSKLLPKITIDQEKSNSCSYSSHDITTSPQINSNERVEERIKDNLEPMFMSTVPEDRMLINTNASP